MKKAIIVFLLTFSFLINVYSSAGLLDTAGFGSPNGYTDSTVSSISYNSLAVQTDGKIVTAAITPSVGVRIMRFNTDGSVDSSFGGASGAFNNTIVFVVDLLIQPDGKVVIAGQVSPNTIKLIRYNSDGTLDVNFAPIVNAVPASMGIQTDNKIVVTGFEPISGNAVTVRFNTNGTQDSTIFEPIDFIPSCLVIQADGKILIGGSDSSGTAFKIARYNPDGTLDNTFGTSGIATRPVLAFLTGIVLYPDGSITVGGSNNHDILVLAQCSQSGVISPIINTGITGVAWNNDLLLQSDGKILQVFNDETNTNFNVVRYLPTGVQDLTFASASLGVANYPPGFFPGLGAGSAFPTATALQQNGYILVGGESPAAVARLARYINSPIINPTTITPPVNPTPGNVTISGTAQNPSNVYLFLDNVLILPGVTTDPLGTNTWSTTLSLTAGTHTLQAVSIYKNRSLDIASDPITFTVAPATTTLEAIKRDNSSGKTLVEGDVLTYSIDVTNTGSIPATGVILKDLLPNCVAFLSATASNGSSITNINNVITADIGTIASNETVTVNISVRIGCCINGVITNNGIITSNNASDVRVSLDTKAVPPKRSILSQAIINKYCPC